MQGCQSQLAYFISISLSSTAFPFTLELAFRVVTMQDVPRYWLPFRFGHWVPGTEVVNVAQQVVDHILLRHLRWTPRNRAFCWGNKIWEPSDTTATILAKGPPALSSQLVGVKVSFHFSLSHAQRAT